MDSRTMRECEVIMPWTGMKVNPVNPSREEWAQLRTERLRTVRMACTLAGYESVYEWCCQPGQDHRIDLLGRAADSSYLARITVYGPGLSTPFRRRLRLVKEARLNLG